MTTEYVSVCKTLISSANTEQVLRVATTHQVRLGRKHQIPGRQVRLLHHTHRQPRWLRLLPDNRPSLAQEQADCERQQLRRP